MTNQKNGGEKNLATIETAGGAVEAEIEIIWLRRISQSQPTAWEGRVASGETAHISYRYGELSISLWRRSRRQPGNWGSWERIVHFRPMEMMAEIHWHEDSGLVNGGANSRRIGRRQEFRLELENQALGEIRSDVWPRKGSRSRIVTARELWNWLNAREKHFTMLRQRGLAGGPMRVKLSALNCD
jgi:hypothetical protein